MYEDLFNMFNIGSTTTETEQETSTTSVPSYNPAYNPYSNDDDSDDYSVRPNYEEQKSYNSTNSNYSVDEDEQERKERTLVGQMATLTIKKDEPTVNLIKKRQRIELQARMKILISMFAVIVASLLFAIAWNFVSVGQMKATFAGKQQEITSLQESIMGLKNEYSSLSDVEKVESEAIDAGYEKIDDTNKINVDIDEVYDDHTINEMPSNWFNDVCEFLSGIFS